MKLTILLVAALAWGSGACGTVSETQAEELTYTYTAGGCTTRQTFKTRDEYCHGLRDEKLNGGCAREVREAAFRSKCVNVRG